MKLQKKMGKLQFIDCYIIKELITIARVEICYEIFGKTRN